jgi:aminoglycoside 3-N-acetyltransferase
MTTDGKTAARRRLADDLKKAGIRKGCPLLIHTSLSALGHVEGGANTVIDALLDAVGPEGTLVIPTLSYLYTNAESPTFDVAKTPTNLGTIPETFRLRHGVARSMHPTHSCAAVGPQTLAVLGEHRHDRSPVGENSPFRKVRDLDGQVAFLGVPHVRELHSLVATV